MLFLALIFKDISIKNTSNSLIREINTTDSSCLCFRRVVINNITGFSDVTDNPVFRICSCKMTSGQCNAHDINHDVPSNRNLVRFLTLTFGT